MAKDLTTSQKRGSLSEMTTAGMFMPQDFADFIQNEGFEQVSTILLGNPADNKIPLYIGELISPGTPVRASIGEQESEMPSWVMRPIRRFPDGNIRPDERVTHIVVAPYDINAQAVQIHKEATERKSRVIVGFAFRETIKTNRNRPLHKFDTFRKFFGATNSSLQPTAALPPTSDDAPSGQTA